MMRKEKCELCVNVATIHCDSDHASLCWDCDRTVHSANFLVAKHSRSVLCNVCHSPTPWKASGYRLFPTVSICELCVHRNNWRVARGSSRWDLPSGVTRASSGWNLESGIARRSSSWDLDSRLQEVDGCDRNGDNGPVSSDSEDEEDEENEENEEEEEENEEEVAENQVVPVPWLAMAAAEQQPPDSSSSSSIGRDEKAYGGHGSVLVKRKLGIWEGMGCSSVQESNDSGRLKQFFRYKTSTAMVDSIVRRKSDGCETPSSSSSQLMANKKGEGDVSY